MKTDHAPEQQLGADRVVEPSGALPQPAERLDASGPVRPFEFEVEVERLSMAQDVATRKTAPPVPGRR